MAEIKTEKTIYQKMQDVRVQTLEAKIKKTGENEHLHYPYYTLDDILPVATKLLAKEGLCAVFNIGYDANGIEMAKLKVTDGINVIDFQIPTASVPRQEGIFEIGSKNTFCKRYLYMNLLELADPDVAEITNEGTAAKPKAETRATEKQVEMINNLYDEENIEKMKEFFHITKIEELTMQQASQVIAKKKGNKNG